MLFKLLFVFRFIKNVCELMVHSYIIQFVTKVLSLSDVLSHFLFFSHTLYKIEFNITVIRRFMLSMRKL